MFLPSYPLPMSFEHYISFCQAFDLDAERPAFHFYDLFYGLTHNNGLNRANTHTHAQTPHDTFVRTDTCTTTDVYKRTCTHTTNN